MAHTLYYHRTIVLIIVKIFTAKVVQVNVIKDDTFENPIFDANAKNMTFEFTNTVIDSIVKDMNCSL